MQDFFFHQSDTLPRLEVTVSGNGGPVDLSSATGVIWAYRQRYTGTANVLSGQFASKSSGVVYVDLTGTTITSSIGPHWGKFIIYFQNGGVRSYPQGGGFINFEILSGNL